MEGLLDALIAATDEARALLSELIALLHGDADGANPPPPPATPA